MGKRLTKIYTRTGDHGTTGLGDGTRISKTSHRVEAMGQVDELNSLLGLMMTEYLPPNIQYFLTDVQHSLFDLGGELCLPGHIMIKPEKVQELENMLDALNDELDPLEEFILPGGVKSASICHVARSVCRRVERTLFSVNDDEKISDEVLQYINRLSDLLFVMARFLNKAEGKSDVLWKPAKK